METGIADNMSVLEVSLTTATVVLAALTLLSTLGNRRLRERLARLKEYGRDTMVTVPEYLDVIVLGPRDSGKTSLIELWTTPWTEVGEIRPSKEWRIYEFAIFDFAPVRRRDEVFDVERQFQSQLRLRIHDYPGENAYRLEAVRKLGGIKGKAILVLLLKVGYSEGTVQHAGVNAEYFSRVFVEEVEQHVKRLHGKVAKCFVVFNKRDLLPPETRPDELLRKLKGANGDAVHQIERTFSGIISYHLISVLTNENLIKLLGAIGGLGAPSSDQRRSLARKLEELEDDFNRA